MELKQYTSSLINPIFCQCCNIIQNIGSVYTQHTLHILCQVDLISVLFQIGNFVKMKFYEYSNTISCLQDFMHVMCMHPRFFSMGFPHIGHGLVLITIHAVTLEPQNYSSIATQPQSHNSLAYAHHPYNSNKTH